MKIKELQVNLDQKILASNRIVIVPHNGIDFDAIASSLGLSLIAKEMHKPSCIIVDDPFSKINRGVQIIITEAEKNFLLMNYKKFLELPSKEDLFILTDVNKNNLISLQEELIKPEQIVIIDHHDPDEHTIKSSLEFIDTSVSSASEVVSNLLFLKNIKINPNIANYLLAGIYLDTNRFSTTITPTTMRTVASLLENGADMNDVNHFFDDDFISEQRIKSLVSNAKIQSFSFAITCGEEDVEYTREELAKTADHLLKNNVDAAFAIGNIGENTISISARSKGKISAGTIMQQLDGGGNQHAGATKITDSTVNDVNKRLIKLLEPTYTKSNSGVN